jgi:hypothetical protein
MRLKSAAIMAKTTFAISILGLAVAPALVSQHAFADGLSNVQIGGSVQGRNVALHIKVNPPVLTTETQQDAFIQVRLADGNNQTIKFTTFIIEVSKVVGSGEDRLMNPDAFHTESGLLTLKIQPQEGEVDVFATRDDFLQAWKADPGGTINIRGQILLEGGLYHFRVDVIGVDNIHGLLPLDEVKTFDAYLSVGDVVAQDIQYEGRTYPTTIISYYDKVQDFTFNPDTLTYSWSMPFNWDTTRIESATDIFVHEEVRIPKAFAGVGDVMFFDGSVNGELLSTGMLALDPFTSEDDLILHFLLSKNDILNLAQKVANTTDTMDFAFSPALDGGERTSGEITTDAGGILVLLDWTPDQLAANEESTLELEFHDAFSGDRITDDVTYDLRTFAPDGIPIHSITNQTAIGGAGSQTVIFPTNETYRIEVDVKAIPAGGQSPDTTRSGIARGTAVVPEFPVGVILAAGGALGSIILYQRLVRSRLQEHS